MYVHEQIKSPTVSARVERSARSRYPHTTANPSAVSRLTIGSKNVQSVLTRQLA